MVGSVSRRSDDLVGASAALGDPGTREALRSVVAPPNITKTLRNAGVVLLIAPDPITGIGGAALLGASYATKRGEPANLQSLAREAAKTAQIVRDLQSLL